MALLWPPSGVAWRLNLLAIRVQLANYHFTSSSTASSTEIRSVAAHLDRNAASGANASEHGYMC
ncbi:flavonoid 3'-monooxygenase-like protein [Anopheles sinensis]|uniref:Flavonoid 3'-monooxygenase-like protein n=1 Tax=Anopheles sinensis TaxID=74873 RepID=A0A084WT68_ANOSI|nr:flavonoid 3'-monooxygenase-like protein [Anopheles sinensis]